MWYILFAIGIIFGTTCYADQNAGTCAAIVTSPTEIETEGRIVLEYGQPLRMQCILNKAMLDVKYPGKNASDLVFFQRGNKIEPKFTRIVNENVLEVFIEKPEPSRKRYDCKLKLRDNNSGGDYQEVCSMRVVIAFKPQKPENFNCVSYDWENLVCSWDPVLNYVNTTYEVSFQVSGRGELTYSCPKENYHNKKSNSCTWNLDTDPIYRQPYEFYTFILEGKNVLGNFTKKYRFDHYANVIPPRPDYFRVRSRTSESAYLCWEVPFPMQTFPPGLNYRLAYRNQIDDPDTWQVIDLSGQSFSEEPCYNLTGLQYPYSQYYAQVYARSRRADSEDRWSNSSEIKFKILPK